MPRLTAQMMGMFWEKSFAVCCFKPVGMIFHGCKQLSRESTAVGSLGCRALTAAGVWHWLAAVPSDKV